MCKAIDDMCKDAAQEKAVEIAKAFIELGKVSLEDIAKATKLPLEFFDCISIRDATALEVEIRNFLILQGSAARANTSLF